MSDLSWIWMHSMLVICDQELLSIKTYLQYKTKPATV